MNAKHHVYLLRWWLRWRSFVLKSWKCEGLHLVVTEVVPVGGGEDEKADFISMKLTSDCIDFVLGSSFSGPVEGGGGGGGGTCPRFHKFVLRINSHASTIDNWFVPKNTDIKCAVWSMVIGKMVKSYAHLRSVILQLSRVSAFRSFQPELPITARPRRSRQKQNIDQSKLHRFTSSVGIHL